jgi:integrase
MYRQSIDRHVLPALADVRVGEATTGLLDAVIRAIASTSQGKTARVVLTGMLSMAARHDAVDHNPVRETTPRTVAPAAARALTVDEVAHLRRNVTSWAGSNRAGPARGMALPEIVDLLLGTGARIGEILALRIPDCALGGDPPTVEITGTIVEGKRQPAPKTDYSYRRLVLPGFAATALRRQIGRGLPTDADELVFPSRVGGPRTPANVRRQLREARKDRPGDPTDTTFDWVSPKAFRKTVATALARAEDIDTAAASSGTPGRPSRAGTTWNAPGSDRTPARPSASSRRWWTRAEKPTENPRFTH